MDLTLPDLATDLADAARRAMNDAGGIDLARRAAREPDVRQQVAAPLVDELGIDALDVRADLDSLLAGAELCRTAGSVAFPFPVGALLSRPRTGSARFVATVDPGQVQAEQGGQAWADHGDLPGPWLAVDPFGHGRWSEHRPTARNRALGPFVHRLELTEPLDRPAASEAILAMTLESCRILGMVEATHRLALEHVKGRRQFGRPLAQFQGVRFHIADAVVAIEGLRQLTHYTLCRVAEQGPRALVDALALRTFALESAGQVLWTGHLLHGAIGFCEEHDLCVLSRNAYAAQQLQTGLARTTELLAAAIDRDGFDGLFEPAAVPAEVAEVADAAVPAAHLDGHRPGQPGQAPGSGPRAAAVDGDGTAGSRDARDAAAAGEPR